MRVKGGGGGWRGRPRRGSGAPPGTPYPALSPALWVGVALFGASDPTVVSLEEIRNLAALSCLRTNSSTVGPAWVAAFESKGRSAQYQPQLSMEFPEKSYVKTL